MMERSVKSKSTYVNVISVLKSYLVCVGSFKRHILYFHASIVEKDTVGMMLNH